MLDLKKTTAQLCADLVNGANATIEDYRAYTPGQLTFKVISNTSPVYNTTSLITDIPYPDESDWITFQYNRLDLSEVFSIRSSDMVYQEQFIDVASILPDVNAAFGVNLSTDDLQIAMVEGADFPKQIQLLAKPGNPIYKGGILLKLTDPAFGLGIIRPNTAYTNMPVSDVFTDSNGHLSGVPAVSSTGSVLARNGEVELWLSVVNSAGDPYPYVDDAIAIPKEDSDSWRVAISAGLYNQANGLSITELYALRLCILLEGAEVGYIRPLDQPSDVQFVNVSRTISLPNALGSLETTAFQWAGYLTQLPEYIQNPDHLIGNLTIALIAERRIGPCPPLVATVSFHTEASQPLPEYKGYVNQDGALYTAENGAIYISSSQL